MRKHTATHRLVFVSFAALLTTWPISSLLAQESNADAAGIQVPPGFQVALYADDDLAHDIYCMTLDSHGNVVVSGAGYIKVLLDTDKDGRADKSRLFAEGPKSGAQGMYFHGNDLLCVGDQGLLRFRDRDGDLKADGPPELFLKFKTGGEHHVHSIQKGPDGWWYLIAGNYAGISKSYVTLRTSPIKNPQAGVIYRMKPDLSGGEVIAHGFRNAYDFAFNSQGDIFTFDSDGERDVSLPWYVPTRVHHVLPGSHAGWASRSWKAPKYFTDMPPVLAEFGRGSPTGVVCYQHSDFGQEYFDSLFVLDWTYGRVLNLQLTLDSQSGEYNVTNRDSKRFPTTFMRGTGQFGFAPTDVEVAPDGTLLVSVGGRGTRGGVYRVARIKKKAANVSPPPNKLSQPVNRDLLASRTNKARQPAVNPIQPLSSWARHDWLAKTKTTGRTPYAKLVEAESNQTIRAIEILTEQFDGLTRQELRRIAAGEFSPKSKARAIWSWSRTQPPEAVLEEITPFLSHSNPLVGRVAAEVMLGIPGKISSDDQIAAFLLRTNSKSRFDRMAAARLMPQMTRSAFEKLVTMAAREGWQSTLTTGFGYLGFAPGLNEQAFRIGIPVLARNSTDSIRLDAIRLMQLGLTDVGPTGKRPAVFDGYAAQLDLAKYERDLDDERIRLSTMFPTGSEKVDFELARLLSMLEPFNAELLTKLLAKITETTHPTNDFHYLIVSSRIAITRDSTQREATAKALVELETKIKQRRLNIDSNWEPRLKELYKTLVKHDPLLPEAIVNQKRFGLAGHVVFLEELPPEGLDVAIEAFVKQIDADSNYQWSPGVVFVVGTSKQPRHRDLVRDQFENFGVRGAVLRVLSESPVAQDIDKFIVGLDSNEVDVVSDCTKALSQLNPAVTNAMKRPQYLAALIRNLRRLGSNPAEFRIREGIAKLLQRHTKQEFGFVFGSSGWRAQPKPIAEWTKWFVSRHPRHSALVVGATGEEFRNLQKRLNEIEWNSGDEKAGRVLFQKRGCIQCHGGRTALGPDLKGAAKRFARDDLFTAIVLPNRDVSSRYQTTVVVLENGKVYTGLIIYESVDGILLRTSDNQTIRIESDEIEVRRRKPESLMPAGLLRGLSNKQWADLNAFLQALR